MCYVALGMRRLLAIFVLSDDRVFLGRSGGFCLRVRRHAGLLPSGRKHHCESGMSDMAGMSQTPANESRASSHSAEVPTPLPECDTSTSAQAATF